MGCTPTEAFKNVTFSCSDKPKGGLEEIMVIRKGSITTATDTAGELDITAVAATSVAKIEFNNKDGFSYAGTEYAGEADGTEKYTPTVAVEVPKVDAVKLEAVKTYLGGFNELVVFVKYRTGKMFAFGYDNGMYGSALTTTSGTNNDKNMMQLTFTGDEDSMEREVDATTWGVLVAALVV